MIRNPGKLSVNPERVVRTRDDAAVRAGLLLSAVEERLELCGSDSVPASVLPKVLEVRECLEQLELLLAQERARADVSKHLLLRLSSVKAKKWAMSKDDQTRMGAMLVAVGSSRSAMARIQSWARGALNRYDKLPEVFDSNLQPRKCDGCRVLRGALESISSPWLEDQIRVFEKHATRKK